ncbi:phospholipid/cholesterol/gamma-HCH transport system substrate-binding protein [Marivirga sericea]|uniref:Phospholipid/cholesterol/gamma-HCH transport system substrate-binding protein n=1 Tax=Marivirga sericea TaxID=1028 RepID=A0A1X7I3R3_9BACT|nr:MlaD family protein [Marivirga sericea]SMG08810.1 phospholipid/cholesterol/gamma-HCH transport system substrate-binding protein [Marivirga sericea]
MKIAKEIKVAVLAIVAIVIFYFGFNFLKGIDFFDPSNEYYAIYDQVDGLTAANPVLLSGLSVGRVSKIEILQEQENKLKVFFEVREDITLGKESVALLTSDILGSQTIVIKRNLVKDPLPEGSEIKGNIEPALTAQIQEQAYPVLKTLDSVGQHLNGILANIDKNEEAIQNIMLNVELTTQNLAKISEKQSTINAVIDDFKKISATLANEKNGLKALLQKTNGIADSVNALELAKVVNRLDTTLLTINSTVASMQDGEGTIDKLLNDDSLYLNLNQTLLDLDALLIDMKDQPKKYVHFSLFGRKDKKKD